MINALPIVGWFLSALVNISLAVPFWIIWTACGIGKTYFDFLPSKYQAIPFWHCAGLFIVLSILRTQIPKLVSVDNSSKSETKGAK